MYIDSDFTFSSRLGETALGEKLNTIGSTVTTEFKEEGLRCTINLNEITSIYNNSFGYDKEEND